MAKTVLATIFMLADTLPRSGRIEIEINASTGWLATVSAIGSGAIIEDAGIASLLGTASYFSLTTNTVIGAMVREPAAQFALVLEIHAETDLVTVTATRYIRNTPNLVASIGRLSAAEIDRPKTVRVSAGSMMPSSQIRAEA